MRHKPTWKKIIYFPLTKIVAGFAVVAGSVALVQWICNALFTQVNMPTEKKDLLTGVAEIFAALITYILLFKNYERRKISELNLGAFTKNSLYGFFLGLLLQTSFVFVLYIMNHYSVSRVNPVSFLLPAFSTAIVAGFIAELLLRGIIFRLIEEKFGTVISLIVMALLFAIIHSGSKGATIFSVISTTIEAGILLSAVYVFTRSLWFSIFFHFAWDFTEPGIFGAINPGNSIEKSLFTSKITGPNFLTGGQMGPQNSIQAIALLMILCVLFLWMAKRKNNFIKPFWKAIHSQ